MSIIFSPLNKELSIRNEYLVSTQLNSSLLTISVIAVLLPAAFHFSVDGVANNDETSDILHVSHGVRLPV